jgi:hypothetical protein
MTCAGLSQAFRADIVQSVGTQQRCAPAGALE